MDQKSVGVGIIGTGWGVNVQLPAIKAISGIETIALYSRSLDKAKSISEEKGVKHSFDDVAELASCEEVDIVSVVTPMNVRYCVALYIYHGTYITFIPWCK